MKYFQITYCNKNENTIQTDSNGAKTILEAISNFYEIMGYREIIKIEIVQENYYNSNWQIKHDQITVI
ncbi:MAG: hypothetical protein WC389_19580 [Lutibacter sp.]|jgi:hypothetical protein